MELGKHLRTAREAAGLSQEELASGAGLHRVYISLLERDKRSPTLNVLERLCKTLSVPVSKLVAEAEKR